MDNLSAKTEARKNLSFQDGVAPQTHDEILTLIRRLRTEGTDAIGDRKSSIELADQTYRAFRVPDKDDKEAAKRGEPIKIIYPITYAQIQTGLAALMSIYAKRPFFELDGRGPQRFRASKLMEAELQYELDQLGWNLTLYLWLQDMFRYGFGKLNIGWETKPSYLTRKTMLGKIVEKMLPGMAFPEELTKSTEKVIGYQGADLAIDDPYDVVFDPTVSIGEIQKAQYVFQTEYISYNDLELQADEGVYFNIEGLKDAGSGTIGRLDANLRPSMNRREELRMAQVRGGNKVVLDKCYIKLVPADYHLAPLDRMQIWKIVMANEQRIIQAEPSRFEHGQMPTAIIEYSPDYHELTNDGMAQTIDGMQEWMNWLLNSHQDSVRKIINDVLIIDPRYINVDDIQNRRPVWKLKEGASVAGIERYVHQLKLQDVTQTHVADAARMFEMIQRTTGLSDNFPGPELRGAALSALGGVGLGSS